MKKSHLLVLLIFTLSGVYSCRTGRQYVAERPLLDTITPKILKVLVIEQDPFLKTKEPIRASVFLKQDKDSAVIDLIDDIYFSSHGLVKVELVKKEHLDEFATFHSPITLVNGEKSRTLDEATWLEIMSKGWWGFWEHPIVKDIRPYSYDYEYLLNKFDLVNRRNRGEFDEVWLVNVDPQNSYESMMVGSTAYWINGKELIKEAHNFKIMNVSISRPDVNFECFGHAAENILDRVFTSRYKSYQKNSFTVEDINDLNVWERFLLNHYATPGFASAGNVHFAPNSERDYDWENKTPVESSWIDWLDYPYLTGKTKVSNSDDWVPFKNKQFSSARQHHRWWFSLMPHITGRTKDGFSNNWWDYLYSGDYVTKITPEPSNSKYKRNRLITLRFTLEYQSGKVENKTLQTIASDELNVKIADETIVRIEKGQLKAVKAGSTTIRVYYDNQYAEFQINVSR